MSRFANGNILLTPSLFIRQCKMNIQNCYFCKRCHGRCHINRVQDFHLILFLTQIFFWLNSGKIGEPYIIQLQVDQAPESVIMNQRVHYFLDLGLSYFDHIKAMSWITAEYLQWTIYVKTKSRVCMYIKKLYIKKIFRPSNPLLGKWRIVFYPLSCTS